MVAIKEKSPHGSRASLKDISRCLKLLHFKRVLNLFSLVKAIDNTLNIAKGCDIVRLGKNKSSN